jgi:hypothetical protein
MATVIFFLSLLTTDARRIFERAWRRGSAGTVKALDAGAPQRDGDTSTIYSTSPLPVETQPLIQSIPSAANSYNNAGPIAKDYGSAKH